MHTDWVSNAYEWIGALLGLLTAARICLYVHQHEPDPESWEDDYSDRRPAPLRLSRLAQSATPATRDDHAA